MTGVRIEGLGKVFASRNGPVQALRDVTLTIGEGELVVVLGPSGSGKTTLLRVLAGLEEPSTGNLLIDDRNVNAVPPQDREVAMVFQDAPLYPHMTVLENLTFGLKLRKCAAAERRQRAAEASEWLGLNPLLDRLPKALSGGERQRVALGRALVLRPRIFLLDEPLSNLDTPLRAVLRQEIVAVQRRLGATMMYVTHDQGEALSLATRVAVLRDGALQQVAPPEGVYRRPANLFVARFIGWPPINLLNGTLADGAGGLWFRADAETGTGIAFLCGEKLTEGARPGLPVVFGIRPEDLGPELEGRAGAMRGSETTSAPGTAAVASTRSSLVEGEVEGSEFQGPDRIVALKIAAARWVARFSADRPVKMGSRVGLELHSSRGSIFDRASGRSLHPVE